MELPVGWGISTLFIIFRPRFRVLFLMRGSFADNLTCFIFGIVFSRIVDVFVFGTIAAFQIAFSAHLLIFLSLAIQCLYLLLYIPDPLASFCT